MFVCACACACLCGFSSRSLSPCLPEYCFHSSLIPTDSLLITSHPPLHRVPEVHVEANHGAHIHWGCTGKEGEHADCIEHSLYCLYIIYILYIVFSIGAKAACGVCHRESQRVGQRTSSRLSISRPEHLPSECHFGVRVYSRYLQVRSQAS